MLQFDQVKKRNGFSFIVEFEKEIYKFKFNNLYYGCIWNVSGMILLILTILWVLSSYVGIERRLGATVYLLSMIISLPIASLYIQPPLRKYIFDKNFYSIEKSE